MKHFNLTFLVGFVLLSTLIINIVHAQGVNMDRYIKLTVQEGENIAIGLIGDTYNTPVKIVSGNEVYDITVNAYNLEEEVYLSGADTMTIYGNIKKIACSRNFSYLTNIDISHNTPLTHLYCFENKLNSLDISQNISLKELACENNQLKNLIIGQNVNLKILRCANNQLSTLDVSACVTLQIFDCFDNQISNLTFGENTSLKFFQCEANQLSELDLSSCVALREINCWNNQLSTLDVSKNIALKSISAGNNLIDSLNISQNINLETLDCWNNQINDLDVSKNTALKNLACSYNQIRRLYLGKNTALKNLACNHNELRNLDLCQNTKLEYLRCNNNQLNSLDVNKNVKLKRIICYENLFTTHAIDTLFCTLPNKNDTDQAVLYLLNNTEDSTHTNAIASNAQNARDKTWAVCYYDDYNGALHDIDIPTTGTYQCTEGTETKIHTPISVYPNPVKDILHINTDVKVMEVQVHNLSGVLVFKSLNHKYFSIAHLPQGVYMLTCITEQGVYTQKIVKQQ